MKEKDVLVSDETSPLSSGIGASPVEAGGIFGSEKALRSMSDSTDRPGWRVHLQKPAKCNMRSG